jgi:hypothetical protein
MTLNLFPIRTAALALLFASTVVIPMSASAQWLWLDKSGHKVFSDQSPPADVPDKNILKRPGRPSSSVSAPGISPSTAAASPPIAPATTTNTLKISGKDAALEKKKAETEAAEASRREAEQQKVAVAKAENCERAKRALVGLQSGVRMAQINAQGEREFMSDEARQAETQRVQGIATSDCQ